MVISLKECLHYIFSSEYFTISVFVLFYGVYRCILKDEIIEILFLYVDVTS